MTTGERRILERVVALRDREALLRTRARRLELIPAQREAATALFARANGLRKARLALLDRCGLR